MAAELLIPIVDYGVVSMGMRGFRASLRGVAIRSNDSAPIQVTRVSISNPQFVHMSPCVPEPLPPGGFCFMAIAFNSVAFPGAVNSTVQVSASVTIEHSGSGGPLTAQLTAVAERSLVRLFFESILYRVPDAPGLAFWRSEVERMHRLGVSLDEVWHAMATSFYSSPEGMRITAEDGGLVLSLYSTFFQRMYDDLGYGYWTAQLRSGMPREAAMASFMFSSEFRAFTRSVFGDLPVRAATDMVASFYRGFLGRLADDDGFSYWLTRMRDSQCLGADFVRSEVERISALFASSGEYAARARTNAQYVGDLYNTFLARGGDLDGVLFWIRQLDSGVRTREELRRAFIASPEFGARIAAVVAEGCLQS